MVTFISFYGEFNSEYIVVYLLSHVRLCNPMNCSTPGFPVLHHLSEFAQTHVHWVCDAIQPSHPLLPPSPPALSLWQHHVLFEWVSSSHQVAQVLELELQLPASVLPVNIQGWFPLDLQVWSPCCPRDSQESSPTSQFKSISSLVLSLFYCSALTSLHDCWKNHSFDYTDLCQQSNVSAF